MGKYHYSYCIMSMLVNRVFVILDTQNRMNKMHFFEVLRAIKQRKLSRPLCELVRYRLGRVLGIVRGRVVGIMAGGFAAIFERSRVDMERVKANKERMGKRKKTEAENAALKKKLARLMEQLSFLATNIQQTFDDDTTQ